MFLKSLIRKLFSTNDASPILNGSSLSTDYDCSDEDHKAAKPSAFRDYAAFCAKMEPLVEEYHRNFNIRLPQIPFTPLISVILPVYNPEIRWLRAAIESVKNQLYSNWELCIADDASTNAGIKLLL